MAVPTPGKMQPRNAAAERGRLVTPPQRLLDKLKPLVADTANLGIRAADLKAFSAVAAATVTIIMVRSTNSASLPYIGVKGYSPKAIDCKPKTAKADDLSSGHVVECAGLVVDPTMVSQQVFKDKAKGAHECWQKFTRDHHAVNVRRGVHVWPRSGGKGFYAVDTAESSAIRRHRGCLMVSQQDVPSDFDPSSSHTRDWMQKHMTYIHGDYDLYGVLDFSLEPRREVNKQYVQSDQQFGVKNLFTGRTKAVQAALNDAIGCDMVQHGEQAAYEFSADDIYVFTPDGRQSIIAKGKSDKEMAGMMSDLFRYVFASELA